jgi:hypothetical protein
MAETVMSLKVCFFKLMKLRVWTHVKKTKMVEKDLSYHMHLWACYERKSQWQGQLAFKMWKENLSVFAYLTMKQHSRLYEMALRDLCNKEINHSLI